MEGDKAAFEAFYERYRGRIYRFIARQFGTSDFGKAAYYSAWRHLVISSRTCKSPKELKFSFFKNLGKPSQANPKNKPSETQANYLPRDIEEDGKWSLVFIDQFRRLPESMKKRFLFKHEIGLSNNAIARIFSDKRLHIEKSIEEAQRILRMHMDEAGCPDNISLENLYRESRVVRPPENWNKGILDSFEIWRKQAENPNASSQESDETAEEDAGLAERLNEGLNWLKQQALQLKLKLTEKAKKANLSTHRR